MDHMKPPEIQFDDDLRETLVDVSYTREYLCYLEERMHATEDRSSKAELMGEYGVWLRCLGELEKAREVLSRALELASQEGVGCKVRQSIRLAHVLQWQKGYGESERLFREVIETCERDFAWQHFGKMLFDQKLYAQALDAFEKALALRNERNAPTDQIHSTELSIARVKRELI